MCKTSRITAVGIVAAAVLWIASGHLMPRDSAEALREYMRVDDARHLEAYLARFDVPLSVMQTADALERIASDPAMDAPRAGVRAIPRRYAPVQKARSRHPRG